MGTSTQVDESYAPSREMQDLIDAGMVELYEPDHPTEEDPAPWAKINEDRVVASTEREFAAAEHILRPIDEPSLMLGECFDPWAAEVRILELMEFRSRATAALSLRTGFCRHHDSARLVEALPRRPRSAKKLEELLKWRDRSSYRAAWHLFNELQVRCAEHFASINGWRRVEGEFGIKQLRERKRSTSFRARCLAIDEYRGGFPELDHPYWYKAIANGRAAGAAALVSQPYGFCDGEPRDRSKLVAKYEALGLLASFPHYPSWWYPGRTSLVLVTADDAEGRAALQRLEEQLRNAS